MPKRSFHDYSQQGKESGHEKYTVGWICALPVELTAAQAVLDEVHPDLPMNSNDHNTYTLGKVFDHHVAIACLPFGVYGTTSAATVASQMLSSFPNIRFVLMVGVGGGVPGGTIDIRLGDVVVSKPDQGFSGVIQYDYGKTVTEGRFERTGALNKPPRVLLTAIAKLQAQHLDGRSSMNDYISRIVACSKSRSFKFPGNQKDILFQADYDHPFPTESCTHCNYAKIVHRSPRSQRGPVIHYGLIASGNQVVKHGLTRDRLSKEMGILCFEMEAAGLMDGFPCLVIRGISDYSDSHKNKEWQPYAAVTAAGYARELLSVVAANETQTTTPSISSIEEAQAPFQLAIDKMDVDEFRQVLSSVDQTAYRNSIQPPDKDNPRFDWIFQNKDFRKWTSDDRWNSLRLSGPSSDDLCRVASDVVSANEEICLYMFCSRIPHNQSAVTTLIHTLLYQYVQSISPEEGKKACDVFLNAVLDTFLPRQTWPLQLDGKLIHDAVTDANPREFVDAFQRVLLHDRKRELFLVVAELDEVSRQADDLYRAIMALVPRLSEREPKTKILFAGKQNDAINRTFLGIKFIEYDKERKECLNSLRFHNVRFDKIVKEHRGSFEWLWKHPQYVEWSQFPGSRLLYIQGKPGSGKSTLTRYYYFNALQRDPNTKSAIIAKFFYSTREGNLQRSHYNMLRSLLYDVVDQHESFFYRCVQSEYRRQLADQEPASGSTLDWQYESLKETVMKLPTCPQDKKIYLLIDAVDESEEKDRRDMLDLFSSICAGDNNAFIKIFLASRPSGFAVSHSHNMVILQDHTKSDIARYTDFILGYVRLDGFLAQARKYITENAQGVFLWVKLVGEELRTYDEQGLSEEDVLEFLKTLPIELEDFYERMVAKMKRNTPKDNQDALKMFKFVLFSLRPLTGDEFLHMLAIPDDAVVVFSLADEAFRRRIPARRRIVHCGGNFIEIVKASDGYPDDDNQRGTVQIIHQTVREFFIRRGGSTEELPFSMTEHDAHISITICCIRYLMICINSMVQWPFSASAWNSDHFQNFANYLQKMPFASYALSHVRRHRECCLRDSSVSMIISQLSGNLVGSRAAFLGRWCGSELGVTTLPWSEETSPDSGDVFHQRIIRVAAAGGYTQTIRSMLALGSGINLDVKDELGRTALSYAAEHAQEAVVGLLLNEVSDLDSSDFEQGWTPISYAAWNGHIRVVEQLLGDGPPTSHTDRLDRTPLSLAAENGREAVVRVLLEKGFEPNAEDIGGQTPLLLSAKNGHEAVVRLLLKWGVHLDSPDKSSLTPLMHASLNGHDAVVKALLEHQPTLDNKDEHYGFTALSYAARDGHEAVVALLLDEDIDPDEMDKVGRTPMSLAAGGGHEETVKQLLRKNVEVDTQDAYGQTPLSWAAQNGHAGVVKLLLDNAADPNSKDGDGMTPLSLARKKGHEAVIRLFLQTNEI